MYDYKNDQPAVANSSDLNEDLGQIQYLFCDKTGTLTENDLIFKQFSVDGINYEERFNGLFRSGTNDQANFQVNYST
jgi:phospholipid-translocating ATPase